MIANRQLQEHINWLLEAGSRAEELIDVPKEYPVAIKAGADYGDLITRPGWKRLLDDLEARANRRLAALRECASNDPLVIKALYSQWKEAEDSLKFVQVVANEAIDRRTAIIGDLSSKLGVGVNVDDFISGAGSSSIGDSDIDETY